MLLPWGNLKLVKTSEDGNVANIEFTVKGDNYSKTAKTNSKGECELTDLVPGSYTVTEVTDSKYETQKLQTVKVESGKTATVTFENVLVSCDKPYTIEEVDTAERYVVPKTQTAPIEWNKVTQRSFENVLKKWRQTVTKTDAETKTGLFQLICPL